MSKKQTTPQAPTSLESVEHALSKSEQYIEENKKSLTIILAAIVVVVGGYMAYKHLYIGPKEIEAQAQVFRAEQYFDRDSFRLALEGDGNALGFNDIIDEYGLTETANLSQYYAGVCYLKMGKFENAIEHLKKFDSGDKLTSVLAIGDIGDAYLELGEYKKAVNFYEKAANKNKNSLTSPVFLKKAGTAYELLGDYKSALEVYRKIKKLYPSSDEARDIDKFIQVATMKM
jgi:tetratricopeptide (TPR) repeat protein